MLGHGKNSNMKKLVSLFLLSLLLVSCGNQPRYGDAKKWLPETLPGDGRVFVYQPRNIFTTISPFTFVLDGKEIVDFYSGTGFYLDIAAGKHLVSYNGGKGKVEIDVPDGGALYLKYRIVTDDVSKSNYIVTNVPAETADVEMESTLLIEPKMPYTRGMQIRL